MHIIIMHVAYDTNYNTEFTYICKGFIFIKDRQKICMYIDRHMINTIDIKITE